MDMADTACEMIVGVRGGVNGENKSGGTIHDNGAGTVRARGTPQAKARGKARTKRS